MWSEKYHDLSLSKSGFICQSVSGFFFFFPLFYIFLSPCIYYTVADMQWSWLCAKSKYMIVICQPCWDSVSLLPSKQLELPVNEFNRNWLWQRIRQLGLVCVAQFIQTQKSLYTWTLLPALTEIQTDPQGLTKHP